MLTLLLTVMISLQIPAVQTKIATYAVTELNKTFGTKINVDRVNIDFFGDVNLYGVSTHDNHDLEFVKIDRVEARLSLWGLIRNPNNITIKKLTLYKPEVQVITYKEETISNFIDLVNKFSKQEKTEESDFLLRGDVEIINGKVLIQNQNLENPNWIDAQNFNALIEKFKLENNEIWANLKQMNFNAERNDENYIIENFSGDFHYSDKEIRFDKLNLKTEDSYLDGHLVFSYNSTEELKDFVNKVQWDVEFKDDSKVNFKDIRYFVKNFDKNSTVEVLGKVSGTLNDLHLNEFQLKGDGAFIAANDLYLTDMTHGDKIVISTKNVKLKTSYSELNQLLPTFISSRIPDFMNRFGTMDYLGDFNLNPNQININGDAITALGNADLNVALTNYKRNLTYKGTVIADNINLKQITEVKELGFVKGRMEFDGVGTDIKTLKLRANGNLAYLDLMDKRYQQVSVNGKLERQIFSGLLSIRDPHLNLNYDGTFDFSGKTMKLDFQSNVNHINLDYLGLTKNLEAKVKAEIGGNFTFSNIDDFLGNLDIKNLHFTSKTDTVDIPEAHLVSSRTDGNQNLELDIPGFLKGEIHGNYRLSQLPDAIMNAVGTTTLLTYEAKPIEANQSFGFYFEVDQDLFSLIDPRIQIAPGTIVDGQVDTNTNSLIAELSSTEIGFDGFNLYNPLINIDTSKNTEPIYLRSDSIAAKGFMIYNMDLYTTPIQDSMLVKTKFQIGKEFPVNVDLNLFHTLDEEENLVFGFSPSTINVDETDWHLNPNNDRNSNRVTVNFKKNYYKLQNVLLESEGQKLLLDGYYASATDYQLNADLEELVLSKLLPKGLLGNLSIDGIANGNIDIIRSKDEFKPLMELKVASLELNKYALGDLGINGVYNVAQNVFDLELFLEQQQVQVLYVNGYIDNKPATPEINLAASLDDLNFKFVESFLSAAMSNVRGMISGEMKFTGPIDSPDFEGMLDMKDLGFTVDYLNVDYAFDGVNTLPVYKQSGGQGFINLDEMSFRDTKFNTKGEVTGQLLFRDFATWFLNLSFNTNNLLVMNTTEKHNELFYGRVFGQGAFELFGPPERLDISAKAIINENSEFTINTGATKVESESSLVRFIPEGLDKIEDDGTPRGMDIDIEVSASPSATINLIFDPVTGDMVTANGYTKDLRFRLSRTGNMTIDGTYTLESGKYELRQIPLLNRDFNIKSGSYVRWNNGNAFEADMNIVANYERTVSNVYEYAGVGQSQTYDVALGIVISESLKEPEMDFTLTIPKGGSDIQSAVDYKFNLDPDEKMIQFGSILLFGQFNTNSESVLTAGATSAGAGIALKQLGGILTSLLSSGGVSVGLDYVSGSQLSNTSDRVKTNLTINLSPRWTFNGAVGIPVGTTYQGDNATGEAEIQWDVSKKMDKSIVVNFFTRPTNFGVQGAGNTNNFQSFGGGIIYKTTFDRFSEIFKKQENTPSPVVTPKFGDEPPSLFDQPFPNDSITPENGEEKDSVEKKKVSKVEEKQKGNSLVRFK
ncbi:hypothetical protein SAMN06296427_10491 [Moheibacter sediminis]|uniref:Translocation and assembly module TamB C-terminal domain-containing protein n=1 Tax=Moheibacter sediminis TaxID=1434700 RepID=A0A1W2AEK6_9FLAO|nr:hypothetical protein SAMN06296427_10491 [Moheibacter sediminis]